MRRTVTLVFALLTFAVTHVAAEERITDGTAFTLEPGEVRIGLLRSGIGLPTPRHLSGLELSTFPVPWASLLADSDTFGVRFANGQIKGSAEIAPRWTTSMTLTAIYGKVGDDELSGSFFGLPLEANINYDLRHWLSVGALAQFTYVSVTGRASDTGEDGARKRYRAEVATRTNTAHIGVNAELRAANWVSFLGEARLTSFGRVSAEASGEYVVDENTTVEGFGEGSAAPFTFGYSMKAVTHLSLGWANLRFGVSYGNYVLPMLNLAVPIRYVMPTANLYFRI